MYIHEILDYMQSFDFTRGEIWIHQLASLRGSVSSLYLDEQPFNMFSNDSEHLQWIGSTPTINIEFDRKYLYWNAFISQVSFFKEQAKRRAQKFKDKLSGDKFFDEVMRYVNNDIDGIVELYCKTLEVLQHKFNLFRDVDDNDIPQDIRCIFYGNENIMIEFWKRCDKADKLKKGTSVNILCDLEALYDLNIVRISNINKIIRILNENKLIHKISASFQSQFDRTKKNTKPNKKRIGDATKLYEKLK